MVPGFVKKGMGEVIATVKPVRESTATAMPTRERTTRATPAGQSSTVRNRRQTICFRPNVLA